MKQKLILVLAATVAGWLMVAQLQSQERNALTPYKQLFDTAETLFNGAATDSTDSVALSYYTQIITQLQPQASSAALLYNCYERTGILKQGLGYAPDESLQDYYAALGLQKKYHLGEDILFRLLLSAGNVHYNKAVFDSSVYYFSWAEKIINHYPAAGLAGDLYNSLGALYNEAGDYRQSGVYFSKALELTRQQHPELGEAIFAMSANIASAVRASGYLDSALHLYKHLFHAAHPSLAIITNISEIYLAKKEPDSALYYLQLAKDIKGFYATGIHNAFAKAYMLKEDTVKAALHLQAAIELHRQNKAGIKNNQYAATQKYLGDLRVMEQQPEAALPYYQQAIIQYDFKFNDTNVLANPGNFTGDFASYSLFNALTAKAVCFNLLYNKTKSKTYYTATVNTYDSAFLLADYIRKSIDNDEARLFIADKVFDAYTNAVDFLMGANPLREENMIHALEWISKSRATSLAINLKENTIKQYAGLPDSLLQQEKNIKISILRWKLQWQQSGDTAAQKALVSAINTATLQLQNIDNKYKKFPNYYNQMFASDRIDISGMQQTILNNNTAAVCYFKGADKLYVFVVKHDKIIHHIIDSDAALEKNIATYIRQLTFNNAGNAYDATAALYLYSKLVQPVVKDLKGVTSLVIIPSQNLINIPFEAFQPAINKYLVEAYAITYQYALPFLQKGKLRFDKKAAIALAPFADKNANATMEVLPYSLTEIAQFAKGAQRVNNAATKRTFISAAGNASVIHLATHAAVDFREPGNSYIAFFRQSQADTGYKMFAHELYNLQLPHTQFVFLSACETGSGKVSRSEGALSISRAFAFAGCPNMVTSLWKAEDKTTAYISTHFYRYVDKGYTYAAALQKAKTDLIADETMTQFHAPAYWSHLIFIGELQEEKSSLWWWMGLAGVVAIVAALVVYKRHKIISIIAGKI